MRPIDSHEALHSEWTERRLALVRASGPRVVFFVAPAGYGKTLLASALRAEYRSSTSVDCAEAEDAKSFVRSVVLGLARENAAQEPYFTELLEDVSRVNGSAEYSSIVESAWSVEPAVHSLFVFENAELLFGDSALLALLTRLLSSTPPSRRVVVCSRFAFPPRVNRYLPAHAALTLSAKHLSLDDTEAAALLERQGVARDRWQRIIEVSRGWPIVLLLLARLAREGRIDSALSDAMDVAFEDLFVYFLYEVLAPLDEATKEVMMLCAAVPGLTTEELRAVTGQTEIDLEVTVRKALLIEREGHHLRIHPLLKAVLLRTETSSSSVLTVARLAEERRNFLRASELYRLAHDTKSAARCLAMLSLKRLQTHDGAYELVQLPVADLWRHAKLVAAAEPYRSDVTPDLIKTVFEQLSEDDDPEVIVAVAEVYSDWSTSYADALEILHSPLVEHAKRVSASARSLLAGWEQTIAVFFDAAASAEHELVQAYHLAVAEERLLHSARMADYLARVKRRRADPKGTIEWREQALLHARKCGAREYATQLLLAIFEAWCWGDERAERRYYEELEVAESSTHYPDYSWALRSLQPDSAESALPLWARRITMCAGLMAASKVPAEQRDALLARAEQACNESGAPAAPVLLARAASDPATRIAYCEKILSILDSNEMPEYCASIRAYMEGRSSHLDPFIARFEPKTSVSRQTVRLEVLCERLTVNGKTLRLTSREAAFLTLLTRRRTGATREEIQEALWPDLDETGARDSLYSLLHRLRKRTGAAQIVEGIGNGYRLGATVQVDLWDMEFIAQKVAREGSPDLLSDADEFYNRARQRSYSHITQYEWFAPIEFTLQENARTLARFLVLEAQKRGDNGAALAYARGLIDEDSCDEWAHEFIIKEYLANGERAQAAYAYRKYCEILRQQIASKPSEHMEQLARAAGLQ
jgi:DNA-binding SARP family transcriptional activator